MDTAVTEPDIVVLATKLNDIHYGMQLQVLQVFGGSVQVDPIDRVFVDFFNLLNSVHLRIENVTI